MDDALVLSGGTSVNYIKSVGFDTHNTCTASESSYILYNFTFTHQQADPIQHQVNCNNNNNNLYL